MANSHGASRSVISSSELETHKALVEVRAGQPGLLRRIVVDAGGWQKIGLAIAYLSDDQAETIPDDGKLARDMLVEFEIS